MNKPSIYSPEFIPFYCEAVEKHKLSHLEGLVYGFVRFYTSSSDSHFYFSNKQMGKILNKSDSSIQRSVSKLIRVELFNAKYKIKANGGKIRFITVSFRPSKNACSEQAKTPVRNKQKRLFIIKDNKIKDNKINIQAKPVRKISVGGSKFITGKEFNDLIYLFKDVNPSYKRLFVNKGQRSALERLIKEHGVLKIKNIIGKLSQIINMPYSPSVTTPYQLEGKLGEIIAFLNKEKNKGGTVDATGIK